MNFYKHFIGDYQRDTGHLSLMEHGAYRLMLDTFYATEKALPIDRKTLYRLLRANGTSERKAIDSVVTQFWSDLGEGLVNLRAAVEIGKAEKQAEVNRQIAHVREEKKRQSRQLAKVQEVTGSPVLEVPVGSHCFLSDHDQNKVYETFKVDANSMPDEKQAINGAGFIKEGEGDAFMATQNDYLNIPEDYFNMDFVSRKQDKVRDHMPSELHDVINPEEVIADHSVQKKEEAKGRTNRATKEGKPQVASSCLLTKKQRDMSGITNDEPNHSHSQNHSQNHSQSIRESSGSAQKTKRYSAVKDDGLAGDIQSGEKSGAVALAKAMRSSGIEAQAADPRIMALSSQGVSPETMMAACEEAKRARPNERIGPVYVVRIVERWAKEAASISAYGARPKLSGSPVHAERRRVMEALTGRSPDGVSCPKTLEGDIRIRKMPEVEDVREMKESRATDEGGAA